MTFFARTRTIDPNDPLAPLEAYREGRKDERRQIETGGPDHRVVKKELDDAYGRGVRDGRGQRSGSPFAVLWFVVLAVFMIATGVMYVQYGSFTGAGAALDRMLAPSASSTLPV
jgi:hypothetical protein